MQANEWSMQTDGKEYAKSKGQPSISKGGKAENNRFKTKVEKERFRSTYLHIGEGSRRRRPAALTYLDGQGWRHRLSTLVPDRDMAVLV